MIRIVFCFLLLVVPLYAGSQNVFSSPGAHTSIEEAINVANDVIKGRTKDFEKKAEKKPLMFEREKKSISQLNKISNSVSDYIEKLKSRTQTEQVLYHLIDDNFYNDLLFDEIGQLTLEGDSLRVKIDSLYIVNKRNNIRGFSQLKQFNENRFNTYAEYYDDKGEDLDYFHHFFYDKSNYGILMSLNMLLLDVKTNQLLFFGTVMSY